MKTETYKTIDAVIEKVIKETSNIKTFIFKPKEKIIFKTGEFIECAVKGVGEAPFTPSSDPHDEERLELTIMNVGIVTKLLHNMKEGDIVGLRGPYGKGYPIDEFKGKRVCVVGGGVGLAPIRSLLFELMHDLSAYKGVTLYYGSRTPEDIVYRPWVKRMQDENKIQIQLTVDKSSASWPGNVGVVTTILNELSPENAVACVCGPPIMMKFATLKLLERGFKEEDIYLSLEKNMSCGIGKCGHCRLGPFYVCKDGPVFKYSQVKEFQDAWD